MTLNNNALHVHVSPEEKERLGRHQHDSLREFFNHYGLTNNTQS